MADQSLPRTHDGIGRIAARLLDTLSAALSSLAAVALVALLGLVAAGFVLRYGFSSALLGAEDAGIWLHVAILSLGMPVALTSALAMRLDVVHRYLPPAPRVAADVVAEALTLLSGLVIAHGSWVVTDLMGGTNAALGLPEWIPFTVFAAGGGLVVLLTTLRLLAKGRAAQLGAAAILAAGLFWFGTSTIYVDPGMPPSLFLALVAALGLAVAAPLPHAFIAAAFIAVPFGSTLPEPALVNTALSGMMKFLLLSVPFFLLAGTLLTLSGVAGKLVRFADSLVGHRRGGLAQTALLTNVLFSGASGSSIAAAAFSASTFQPELVKRGYAPAKAGAIVAATSMLDNVIPPSIAFLILATATNLSVGSLLVGGLWAGLLLALALFLVIRVTCRDTPLAMRSTPGERARLAVRAAPAFCLGLIVVLGIRFGIVTTTEAAAVAAIYTLGLSLYYRMSTGSIFAAFRQSATEAAAIALLIASAAPFAFMLAVDDISGGIAQMAAVFGSGPVAALVFSVLLLFVAGLFLDIGAAILLLAPLLLPLAVAAGLDPVVFGVIVVVNLMIGGLTPPFGVLIFVVSGVTGPPTTALFRAVLPYVGALTAALVAVCLFAFGQTLL
ncbi:TRAP transporter large permease subunit [Cereibacter sp. SYSU M97828]|nr:TRAP transporter large permease subunit [Cereibacter flavus]